MERLRGRLYERMAARGVIGEAADTVYTKITAFTNSPSSQGHAGRSPTSCTTSSWIKYHEPAAFSRH